MVPYKNPESSQIKWVNFYLLLMHRFFENSDEGIMYPELSNFICTREECRSTIAKNIIQYNWCGVSGNKSEDMLHHPMNSMIRVLLKTFNRILVDLCPSKLIGTRKVQERQFFFLGPKNYFFLKKANSNNHKCKNSQKKLRNDQAS